MPGPAGERRRPLADDDPVEQAGAGGVGKQPRRSRPSPSWPAAPAGAAIHSFAADSETARHCPRRSSPSRPARRGPVEHELQRAVDDGEQLVVDTLRSYTRWTLTIGDVPRSDHRCGRDDPPARSSAAASWGTATTTASALMRSVAVVTAIVRPVSARDVRPHRVRADVGARSSLQRLRRGRRAARERHLRTSRCRPLRRRSADRSGRRSPPASARPHAGEVDGRDADQRSHSRSIARRAGRAGAGTRRTSSRRGPGRRGRHGAAAAGPTEPHPVGDRQVAIPEQAPGEVQRRGRPLRRSHAALLHPARRPAGRGGPAAAPRPEAPSRSRKARGRPCSSAGRRAGRCRTTAHVGGTTRSPAEAGLALEQRHGGALRRPVSAALIPARPSSNDDHVHGVPGHAPLPLARWRSSLAW